MINPFMQQQGRRNVGAQNSANPFQRSTAGRPGGSPNAFMQQGSGPSMQQAPTPNPFVKQQQGVQAQPGMAQNTQNNPFTYDPNQRSPEMYQGGYWPNSGELTLLTQGIDPWGGQYGPEQQQWLQQVAPYMKVPELNQSYSGRTELGRDFTAVNLADKAGGDPSKAFRDAWLGATKPQISQNLYGVWHGAHNSGANQAAHDQWGSQYGWGQPAGSGQPPTGPGQPPARGGTRPGGTNRFGG